MTNPNLTQIKTVVDRSGSMASCQEDMRGALNAFFEEQAKLPGECVVDYAQFDSVYELVYTDKPVAEARAILRPRNMTALVDAVGHATVELGEKLAAQPEDKRPGKVIVVIVTDGGENASRDWKIEDVKALVEKQQREFNWEFVFLGANIDAVSTGGTFGIAAASSLTYNTQYSGATMDSLSTYVGTTRSGLKASFSDDDRKTAVGSK